MYRRVELHSAISFVVYHVIPLSTQDDGEKPISQYQVSNI